MRVGRPLKFQTVEDMETQIQAYFDDCEKTSEPLTITGLAMALDTSRETLMNYSTKEEYFDTIKRAKLIIENAYEKRLISNGRAGEIFALKNFGWKDRQEIDSNVNFNKSPVDELISSIEDIKNENKQEILWFYFRW